MGQRAFLWALGVSLIAGVPGCRQTAGVSSAYLVDVRIVDRSVAADKGWFDTASLTKKALAQLAASRLLIVSLGNETRAKTRTDYRLRIEVAFAQVAGPHNQRIRALVVARLVPVDGPGATSAPIIAQAAAERILPSAEPTSKAAAQAHIERALGDVLAILIAKLRIHRSDTDQLLAALHDPDLDVREEAVRVAGLRRERRAVQALCEIVKRTTGDELRDLALGALIEIGDAAAVPILTRTARFNDLDELPKLIDAVASLGGDEARAFLEFVASSHDNAEVKALARQALMRMARRQDVAKLPH